MLSKSEIESVGKMRLFRRLSGSELEMIGRSSFVRTFDKGDKIFRQDDDAGHFFGVLDGWVKVHRLSDSGGEALLGLFGKGETFAEAAMFLGRSYPASAEAVEQTRLCFFSADAFGDLAETSPTVMFGMLGSISAHLHEMTLQVEQLKTRNARQRIGIFLLRMSGKPTGSAQINLPFDKSLLAGRLGMTPESLSRNLSALKEVGVSVAGETVTLSDCDRLRRYCTASPLRQRVN